MIIKDTETKVPSPQQTQPLPRMAPSEEDILKKEVQELEKKLPKLEKGSLEHMLLEMHIDMKRDTAKLMVKIDGVASTANVLVSDVAALKVAKTDLDTRLQT